MFRFRAPLPSGFPELLTPPPVRFSSMPFIMGVWIFSGITHYDVIDHPFPINSQYLKTWGVDSPAFTTFKIDCCCHNYFLLLCLLLLLSESLLPLFEVMLP